MSLRTADLGPGGARLGNIVLPLQQSVTEAAHAAHLSTITLGVRPEAFSITQDDERALKMEVKLVEELGADAYVYGSLSGDASDDRHFIVRFGDRVAPHIGDTVSLAVQAGDEHAFHTESGERLGI